MHQEKLKVIAFNEYFDTLVDDVVIMSSSLNGKFINEYEDVLYRAYLQILAEDADAVLKAIRQCGDFTTPIPSTGLMPDEDDRVFYDTATIARAYLIAGNTRHYPTESFILTPAEFLTL